MWRLLLLEGLDTSSSGRRRSRRPLVILLLGSPARSLQTAVRARLRLASRDHTKP